MKWFNAIVLCLLMHPVFAQTKCNSRLLRKSFLQARNDQYFSAIKTLEKSLIKYPNCAATFTRLSELYYRTNNLNAAGASLQKLYNIDEREGESILSYLLKLTKKYRDDQGALVLLKAVAANQKLTTATKSKIDQQINEISYMLDMVGKSAGNIPQVLDDSINIGSNQSHPTIGKDGKQILFCHVENGANEQIYFSNYDSCLGWIKAKALPNPPNTSFPEGTPRLSADGYYLLITRCDIRSELGWDGGGCDILLFYKTSDTTWSPPLTFGATVNSPNYEGQACINSHNNEIYFASNRAGGFGGMDIWKTKLVNGLWQKPTNLGAQINTSANEASPFIHPDGKSFYFASTGHRSLGGYDLYKSELVHDSLFSEPVNLGFPTNTVADEQGITVGANGKSAWFSKNNQFDDTKHFLYGLQLDKKFGAQPIVMVHGIIRDKFTKDLMKNLPIRLLDSVGNLIKVYRSNEGDASFAFPLQKSETYNLKVAAVEGYKDFSFNFNPKNMKAMEGFFELPISLKLENASDTLYSHQYLPRQGADTQLVFLINTFCAPNSFDADSMVIYLDFVDNEFVDTSFANTVCFSDEGYKEFCATIQKTRIENKTANDMILKAYQKYLVSRHRKIHVVTTRRQDSWTEQGLYKININVVEYY